LTRIPRYRVGRSGARVEFTDGSCVDFPPGHLIQLEQLPKKITGSLFPLDEDGRLGYEAPQLLPLSSTRMYEP